MDIHYNLNSSSYNSYVLQLSHCFLLDVVFFFCSVLTFKFIQYLDIRVYCVEFFSDFCLFNKIMSNCDQDLDQNELRQRLLTGLPVSIKFQIYF